jgi:hypothetical protein
MNYFLAVILLKTSDMPSNIHCLRHTPSGGPIVYHTPTQLAMLSEEKLHVFPYVFLMVFSTIKKIYIRYFFHNFFVCMIQEF